MRDMLKSKSQPPDENADEGFLSRWSRRKHAQRSDSLETTQEEDPQLLAEQEEPAPCDENMPAIETLTEDSDYSGFLSPNVSEELRSLALRKLFHSTAFNVCDELDDYAEDFTSFAKLGNIITADMKYQLEEAGKKLEQRLSDTVEADDLPEGDEQTSIAGNSMEEPLAGGDSDDDERLEAGDS